MHRDPRHARAMRELEHREDVRLVAVHAARREQAHHVQGAVVGDGIPASRIQFGIGEEAAVLDRGIHPGQVLVDDPAGAQVHVANLGIAHLPIRQADVAAFGMHQCVRAGRQQAMPVGQVGLCQCVVLDLLAVAPTIQDQQHHGLGTGGGGSGHDRFLCVGGPRSGGSMIVAVSKPSAGPLHQSLYNHWSPA